MFTKKSDFLLLSLIFLVSFVVRSYKISDNLFFGFEQGRDLQIIQKIYQFKDFVLVGPSTSIGGVFHGPWYYYLLSIPLGLGFGNPLAASILLIILGAFVPVVIYFLAKNIFNSRSWGIVAGILSIFSYEYILYSRWLSNVSPAPLFIALAFLVLWKYIETKRRKHFLSFAFFAGGAVLFQMILLIQFIFVLIILVLFKLFRIPPVKDLILAIIILIILFSPLILFDLRNENITLNSLLGFIYGGESKGSNSSFGGILVYLEQMRGHLQVSLANVDSLLVQVFVSTSIATGMVLSYRKKIKKPVIFLSAWILMGLPLIYISPGNPQYYVGIGLGWILLFVMTLKIFWETKNLKITAILLLVVFFLGMITTVNNLLQNKDVFFRTIQDDLNYADQRRVLDFIHFDSKREPYRLVSFTIPSLQPEAWDYLKQYFYPDDQEQDTKIIYIVIEKNVYPVWENKWIKDLGSTSLSFEKNFGLLKVQKRVLNKSN